MFIMEFITEDDLKKITSCAGEDVNHTDYALLKKIYEKLDFLCREISKKGYEFSIRKDPRKQAGQGQFEFQHYQWAKIYPKGFRQYCNDKFSYVIALSDTLHFHMMGIKDLQEEPASESASDQCWKNINLSTADYDSVVEEFIEFDKKYRQLFINTAIELGIKELFEHKKAFKMDKYIEILKQKKQIILQGPPGTGKTYTAKDISEFLILGSVSVNKDEQFKNLEKHSDQFKIIQFHPAYSYEDLVRGITVKSNGTHIEYITENKALGEFARAANENFKLSRLQPVQINRVNWVNDRFVEFVAIMQDELTENGQIPLTTNKSISDIDEDSFRYNGFERLNFSQIKNLYLENITERRETFKNPNLQGHIWYRWSYYLPVLNRFKNYIGDAVPPEGNTASPLKDFILIIDEINRANLPSVMGELIYVLEYRNQSVDSMYEIDGDRKLILPPNLYIIGTMNTADRSVGHIDYAIRRRFAFIDILPSKLPVYPLAEPLFKIVSELFIENYETFELDRILVPAKEYLASDFRPEDIWVGHSYFISNKETEEEARAELRVKRDYEIVPLLKEYLKDGILLEKATEKIKEIQDFVI